MINRRRFKQIEEIAERILRQTQSLTVPVPVYRVADELLLRVIGHDFGPEISGILIKNGGVTTIGYNSENSPKRRRFTVAHEIGHYALEHQREGMFIDNADQHFSIMFRDVKSSTGESLQEREANAFAAAMLMPKSLLIDQISKANFDLSDEDDIVQQLATLFEVSTQAMTYRLANIGILNSASS